MKPQDNRELTIAVWCDWLEDCGIDATGIRDELVTDPVSSWHYEYFGGGDGVVRVGGVVGGVGGVGDGGVGVGGGVVGVGGGVVGVGGGVGDGGVGVGGVPEEDDADTGEDSDY